MTSPTMYYTSVYCFALLLKCIAANSLIKKKMQKRLSFLSRHLWQKRTERGCEFLMHFCFVLKTALSLLHSNCCIRKIKKKRGKMSLKCYFKKKALMGAFPVLSTVHTLPKRAILSSFQPKSQDCSQNWRL